MNHAAAVGIGDRPGHLLHEPGRLQRRQGAFPQPRLQALALDQIHREVVSPIVLADLEDADDAGMIQVGGGFRLDAEPLHVLPVGKPTRQDHLDRHQAVQADLPGLVHDPHAPFAELVQEHVVAKIFDRGSDRRVVLRRIRGGSRLVVHRPKPLGESRT